MPSVDLRVQNFAGITGLPNGRTIWGLSWPKLVWAAITVGRGSLSHVVQHGRFSMFEIVYRCAILYANLLERPDGYFGRSEAYDGLDPSEKGAISYFLGLTLTKAFAEQMLNIPWLMHFDVYRLRIPMNILPGERPDLFGQDDQGRWVIAESKGRTNEHDAAALQKAKAQSSQVVDIGGIPPSLHMGVVASFNSGRLTLVADDPPPTSERTPIRISVTKEEFQHDYYRPFRAALQDFGRRERRFERDMLVARDESLDLTFGVVEDHPEQTWNQAREVGLAPAVSEYLGDDGVYVLLGDAWRPDKMREEPQARR